MPLNLILKFKIVFREIDLFLRTLGLGNPPINWVVGKTKNLEMHTKKINGISSRLLKNLEIYWKGRKIFHSKNSFKRLVHLLCNRQAFKWIFSFSLVLEGVLYFWPSSSQSRMENLPASYTFKSRRPNYTLSFSPSGSKELCEVISEKSNSIQNDTVYSFCIGLLAIIFFTTRFYSLKQNKIDGFSKKKELETSSWDPSSEKEGDPLECLEHINHLIQRTDRTLQIHKEALLGIETACLLFKQE